MEKDTYTIFQYIEDYVKVHPSDQLQQEYFGHSDSKTNAEIPITGCYLYNIYLHNAVMYKTSVKPLHIMSDIAVCNNDQHFTVKAFDKIYFRKQELIEYNVDTQHVDPDEVKDWKLFLQKISENENCALELAENIRDDLNDGIYCVYYNVLLVKVAESYKIPSPQYIEYFKAKAFDLVSSIDNFGSDVNVMIIRNFSISAYNEYVLNKVLIFQSAITSDDSTNDARSYIFNLNDDGSVRLDKNFYVKDFNLRAALKMAFYRSLESMERIYKDTYKQTKDDNL